MCSCCYWRWWIVVDLYTAARLSSESVHRFSRQVGRNVRLTNAECSALRCTGYDGGLVFSSEPLRTDELLQVTVLLGSTHLLLLRVICVHKWYLLKLLHFSGLAFCCIVLLVYSVTGWTRGVQVKLWDPLRTRAIPEHLRGVFTTRRYTNPRSPPPSLCIYVC